MDAQQVLALGATSNSSCADTHVGHIFAGSPLGKPHGLGQYPCICASWKCLAAPQHTHSQQLAVKQVH